jgi:hypothetical protein
MRGLKELSAVHRNDVEALLEMILRGEGLIEK